MVTLAEELPFAAAVDDGRLHMTCSNCFAYAVSVHACKGCRIVHYCSAECQKADWMDHKTECKFLRTSDYVPLMLLRIISRAHMRVKRGDVPVAFNGRTFHDMMDHAEDLKQDQNLVETMENVCAQLTILMGRENAPSFEETLSIYGKYTCNSFGITDTTPNLIKIGSGIYVGMSAHDHSCLPDGFVITDGKKLILRSLNRKLSYSKDLTINYIPVTVPTWKRKESLQNKYFFECKCVICKDKERDLLCASGRASCCEFGAILPVEGAALVCNKCGSPSSITLEEIYAENENLKNFNSFEACKSAISRVDSIEDLMPFMSLYDSSSKKLSPFNLGLYNLAYFIYSGAAKIERRDILRRFTFCRRPAVQALWPFSYTSTLLLIETAIATVVDERTDVTYADEYEAFKRCLVSVRFTFGDEHTLTKKYERVTIHKKEDMEFASIMKNLAIKGEEKKNETKQKVE